MLCLAQLVSLGSSLYVSACTFPHRVGAELPSVYDSSSKPALCSGVFLLAFHRILSSLHAYETTDSGTIYTVETPRSGAALHSAPTMTEIPDFELMKNAEEALIP